MEKLPIVREHMDTQVCALNPETEILEAVGFLLEHHVTGAPVVDEAGHLVGMLTEKDCLRLIATGADADRPRGTVADFMTTAITTISPDTDV
jgi:CBS domain-containing protein